MDQWLGHRPHSLTAELSRAGYLYSLSSVPSATIGIKRALRKAVRVEKKVSCGSS